jgi:hypothetical protein
MIFSKGGSSGLWVSFCLRVEFTIVNPSVLRLSPQRRKERGEIRFFSCRREERQEKRGGKLGKVKLHAQRTWLPGKVLSFFIRLRRRPRALPVDECVNGVCAIPEPRYRCFGGFRHWRITLRSLDVGGYFHGGTTDSARGAP